LDRDSYFLLNFAKSSMIAKPDSGVTAKPVVPGERANRDVEQAVDFYCNQAGASVATKFINSLERTYRAIAANPASGSPRDGFELNIPGLRNSGVDERFG
jgi:plasmid stabilization system protein ParE